MSHLFLDSSPQGKASFEPLPLINKKISPGSDLSISPFLWCIHGVLVPIFPPTRNKSTPTPKPPPRGDGVPKSKLHGYLRTSSNNHVVQLVFSLYILPVALPEWKAGPSSSSALKAPASPPLPPSSPHRSPSRSTASTAIATPSTRRTATPPAVAQSIHDTQGLWAFYTHWGVFEFQAVCHILTRATAHGDDFRGKILDFGAGHSVYERPEELAAVETLMAPFEHVFLILPCDSVDEAAQIMEARRGKQLPLNQHFLTHESNRRLAKHTIYTKDKTPAESAEEILRILRKSARADGDEETSLSAVV